MSVNNKICSRHDIAEILTLNTNQSISQSLIYYCHYKVNNFDWYRDPEIGDNVSPPSYTEATDTSCLEPPTIVPEVSPDENEAPPTYEEAVEDSQHSFSETDISERRPVWCDYFVIVNGWRH